MRQRSLVLLIVFFLLAANASPAFAAETSLDLNQILSYYRNADKTFAPITLVTPESPSESEMRALVTLAAGLGKLTEGKISIEVLPIGSLTDATKSRENLIFIGKSGSFPIFKDLILPLPLLRQYYLLPDRYEFEHASDGYGVIQLLPSPWNADKTMLIISASDDAGVVNAAQAFTTGKFLTNTRADVAIVKRINPSKTAKSTDGPLNLFGGQGWSAGEGNLSKNFTFYLPANLTTAELVKLNLSVSVPVGLDLNRSGVVIGLNGFVIASLPLNESNSVARVEIEFASNYLRVGKNTITFTGKLFPLVDAVYPNLLTVTNGNLELDSAENDPIEPPRVSDFPDTLISSADLRNLTFVVPANEPMILEIVSQLAFGIGANADGAILLPELYFNTLPAEKRTQRNIIFIGKPSQFPLLAEAGDALPGSYERFSPDVGESAFDVEYRSSPTDVVGHIQITRSLWDVGGVLLVIGGNNLDGVKLAAAALLDPQSRARMDSNLVLISDGQIVTAK